MMENVTVNGTPLRVEKIIDGDGRTAYLWKIKLDLEETIEAVYRDEGGGLLLKLHQIDRFETGLSQTEIQKRMRDIALEDKFFNICIKDKKIYRVKFKDDSITFFYLSHAGVQDMLSPQLHIRIFEKEKGCACGLYHSSTYGILLIAAWWSIFWGACAVESLARGNLVMTACYAAIYMSGIWIARKRRMSTCKKAADVLRNQLKVTAE